MAKVMAMLSVAATAFSVYMDWTVAAAIWGASFGIWLLSATED